ncbi:hypothetical protein NPIL_343591 [Nephila pilipes]|uniref:TGF-beta family profile domain-containing protein n=1 Tax=Nephila pilipes TaxID=299642 RepID=A0A8X6NQT0_NEPPI|nr:hypothetical protein NPIL_343591 [Nephila pilipes]
MKTYNITQTIPKGFKRLFVEWYPKNSCIPKKMKSHEIKVTQGLRRYRMRYRIPRKKGSDYTKVELWIELHGIFKKDLASHSTYECVAQTRFVSKKLKARALDPDHNVINDNLVELSYDITELYSELNALNEKSVRFKIRLCSGATGFHEIIVKSFIVFYEKYDCVEFSIDSEIKPRLGILGKGLTTFSNRLSKSSHNRIPRKACALKDWEVTFELGVFNECILYPINVNLHTCKGFCDTPKASATPHAVVQAIHAQLFGDVPSPCCVPVAWKPLTLIMMVDKEIIITSIPNFIATECGCP